jgi:hypothetical protein
MGPVTLARVLAPAVVRKIPLSLPTSRMLSLSGAIPMAPT